MTAHPAPAKRHRSAPHVMASATARANVTTAAAVALACAALAGCGTMTTDILKQPGDFVSGSLSSLGKVQLPSVDLSKIELPAADLDPVGPPTLLYGNIARGAKVCWFGAHGPLKASHVFDASAEPESKGGAAEISIHERDANVRDLRGNRAFFVTITPGPESATLAIENVRFPAEVATRMQREVRRWGRGDFTCTPPEPAATPATTVAAPGAGTTTGTGTTAGTTTGTGPGPATPTAAKPATAAARPAATPSPKPTRAPAAAAPAASTPAAAKSSAPQAPTPPAPASPAVTVPGSGG